MLIGAAGLVSPREHALRIRRILVEDALWVASALTKQPNQSKGNTMGTHYAPDAEFVYYRSLSIAEKTNYDYEGRVSSEDDEQYIVICQMWGA